MIVANSDPEPEYVTESESEFESVTESPHISNPKDNQIPTSKPPTLKVLTQQLPPIIQQINSDSDLYPSDVLPE